MERKQVQIRKVYPGLSCFKEGVRQIPIESIPGIRELPYSSHALCIVTTLHLVKAVPMIFNYLNQQVKLDGNPWAKAKGKWDLSLYTCRHSTCSEHHVDITVPIFSWCFNLTLFALVCCRKELKDPDQLYSTLKTILQHVKVRELHIYLYCR